MIAHIGFSLSPAAVHHFSIAQQVQAMLLGLFYAYYFHRTRSLLAPVLVHNLFNFLLTSFGVIWALVKG
jgi:membrane protease YdiL (CAAX protease family)